MKNSIIISIITYGRACNKVVALTWRIINKNAKSAHLYRLDKSVEENSYANRTSEQLDQSCRSEKSKESDFNDPGRVDDAPRHRDEVEPVPTVFEVRLQKRDIIKYCPTGEDAKW